MKKHSNRRGKTAAVFVPSLSWYQFWQLVLPKLAGVFTGREADFSGCGQLQDVLQVPKHVTVRPPGFPMAALGSSEL